MSAPTGSPTQHRTWRAEATRPPGQSHGATRSADHPGTAPPGLAGLDALVVALAAFGPFRRAAHRRLRRARRAAAAVSGRRRGGVFAVAAAGNAIVLGDLQTSQSIATLNNRLQGLAARRGDTLILYLRVYGVSDDGKAWVLCSDYLRTTDGGRLRIGRSAGPARASVRPGRNW